MATSLVFIKSENTLAFKAIHLGDIFFTTYSLTLKDSLHLFAEYYFLALVSISDQPVKHVTPL